MDRIGQPEDRHLDDEISAPENDVREEHLQEGEELSNLIIPDEDQPDFAVEPILDEAETEKMIGVPEESLHLPYSEDTTLFQLIDVDLVSEEDVKALWNEALELQGRIKDEIIQTLLAEELIEKIALAQSLIMTGMDCQNALKLVSSVEHRLSMQKRVKQSTRKVVPWILVYEIICLVGFGASIFWLGDQSRLDQVRLSLSIATIDLSQFLATILWGGLGALLGHYMPYGSMSQICRILINNTPFGI